VGKLSDSGQPTWRTQLSIPLGSVNEYSNPYNCIGLRGEDHQTADQGCEWLFGCGSKSVARALWRGLWLRPIGPLHLWHESGLWRYASVIMHLPFCRRRRVSTWNAQLRRGERVSQHWRIVSMRGTHLSVGISSRLRHWQLRSNHMSSRTKTRRCWQLRRSVNRHSACVNSGKGSPVLELGQERGIEMEPCSFWTCQLQLATSTASHTFLVPADLG